MFGRGYVNFLIQCKTTYQYIIVTICVREVLAFPFTDLPPWFYKEYFSIVAGNVGNAPHLAPSQLRVKALLL